MPRPCKRRRICAMPEAMSFGPKGCVTEAGQSRQSGQFGQSRQSGLSPQSGQWDALDTVNMTLDEYETIRLMDLLGYTQEEAAASMDVSRTTVQAIYESARHKLAQALCESRELRIGGGNYILCEGRGRGCSCRRCQKEEE
ncbi:MAG: DUF134 domain-containing protein [Firmicutes bacterium]|nr:DUF134 domain-containing protein [Bacillota bacterium]